MKRADSLASRFMQRAATSGEKSVNSTYRHVAQHYRRRLEDSLSKLLFASPLMQHAATSNEDQDIIARCTDGSQNDITTVCLHADSSHKSVV